MKSFSESYKAAGVDVTAGYRAVELMKEHIAKTMLPNVLSPLGGFGGLFELDVTGLRRPVLVSGTDGVGTKLKIAFLLDRHDTIGIDCVAMCVNDVLCSFARPQFFLDYIALDRNVPEKVAEIVSGVAKGCVEAGCALIGGETAEMPGFYHANEYDIAGFCVALADYDRLPDPKDIHPGDAVIGIASSGLHSNGFSLVRKVLDIENADLLTPVAQLGKPLGEELLTPTKIYVKPVLAVAEKIKIKAVAHITGGGFYENIPRALPDTVDAVIDPAVIETPPIFSYLGELGGIPKRDLYNTFNMGVGMVLVVGKEDADRTVSLLQEEGEKAWVIGEIQPGKGEVVVL